MPLELTTPAQVSETISSIDLTSFTFDIKAKEIHIAYDEGEYNAGTKVFAASVRDKLATVPESEIPTFLQVWGNTQGPNEFAILRRTILKYLEYALANRDGTVIDED